MPLPRLPLLLAIFLAGGMLGWGTMNHAAEKETSGMIVHDVYFQLKDNSPAKTQELVDACVKYLKPQPGVVFFACGTMAKEFDRPVNDRDWDVGLHVVFTDQAAHDRYQEDANHLKFIEENKENWAKVRVFDTVTSE
ncbi:Stress responsive A/B Barrel Domain [Planctomycetales bacterium 10988]|nr:Stress responsive A/B Barrel Domain [Planctomycetales bacterium 10988]